MQDLPQEFLLRMERMLGEEYPSFLASYEKERSYGLRLNTLKFAYIHALDDRHRAGLLDIKSAALMQHALSRALVGDVIISVFTPFDGT